MTGAKGDMHALAWLEECRRGERRLLCDEILFHRGDPVTVMYRVDDGSVRLERRTIDGRLLVLHKATAGDLLGEKYVVGPVARHTAVNRHGRLYVLIGRSVFSAGMSNASQFRTQTHAILVGERIGERPNSWQEAREFTLPRSHLVVRYSTKFYRFAPAGQNLIAPDVTVAPTWRQ